MVNKGSCFGWQRFLLVEVVLYVTMCLSESERDKRNEINK